MKIIVGLGNPGEKYENTRHNAGFVFADKLAVHPEISPVGETLSFHKEDKFSALIAETLSKGEKVLIVKPQTYMNRSGEAVSKIMEYYKIIPADLIVISDDVDIPVGTARVRNEGSSGGQKGLQNIIERIGSDKFARVRIGIQKFDETLRETDKQSDNFDAADFVLSQFEKRELPLLDEIMDDAIEYILPFLGKDEEMVAHTLKIKVDSL